MMKLNIDDEIIDIPDDYLTVVDWREGKITDEECKSIVGDKVWNIIKDLKIS